MTCTGCCHAVMDGFAVGTPNKAMHVTSARGRQFTHTSLAYRFGGLSGLVARREGRAEARDCRR
jgi:hypothetical protein